MPSFAPQQAQAQAQPYPSRLALALKTQGLQAPRSQKRKADSSPVNPRPAKIPAQLKQYRNISLSAQRYASASRIASVVLKAGFSKFVAMKVFDQVYETGSYDRALVGELDSKPVFDYGHPRNRYLDRRVVDVIWMWEWKWSSSDGGALEDVSPTTMEAERETGENAAGSV